MLALKSVWLLQDGAKYEGYTVVGVYASYPLAQQARADRVRAKQQYGLGQWDMAQSPNAGMWWDIAGWSYVAIQECPVIFATEGAPCSPSNP